MKKIFAAIAAVLFVSAFAGSQMNEKITICHMTGNGSSHSITISIHALPHHLSNHGDSIGECGSGEQ